MGGHPELVRAWPAPARALDADELAAAYDIEPGPPERPWVTVNFVTSVDGAVTVAGRTAGLAGPGDRAAFRLLRRACDALVVGAGTLRNERYGPLAPSAEEWRWRMDHGRAPAPVLVVVSGRLELDPDHQALARAPARPLLITHAAAPQDRRRALEAVADVLVAGDSEVDLAAGLGMLAARGLCRVLSEGGPWLFGALTAADLVDDMCLTVSPLLAGAGAGRITAGPPSAVRDLTLRHILVGGDELLLRYARRGPGGEASQGP